MRGEAVQGSTASLQAYTAGEKSPSETDTVYSNFFLLLEEFSKRQQGLMGRVDNMDKGEPNHE